MASNDSANQYLDVYDGSPLTSNSLSHVCVTYSGTSAASGVALYVNGAAVGTATALASLSGATTASSSPLYIGARSATVSNFGGAIGGLLIYNRVLSPSEISTIYAAGIQ